MEGREKRRGREKNECNMRFEGVRAREGGSYNI